MLPYDAARREAFTALFSQLSPRLYRTALGILGNPHDAADALQEAGLKAYRYFDKLHQAEAGAAWLTRILINACYDTGRRRSRTTPIGLDVEPEAAPELPPETDWELVQALQALPEEQRTTVVLRFFQDLTVPQIALIMSVPDGTVKSRLHAALSRMRGLLTENRKEGVR
ncbi:MAG TPA: sigma-70 family RNA polymerase sigma factor [Symbiobacteriaceae bacterium]|nr:sigma-70 family RNA polymerase sigma factor [Symbiobacteriaceae bacterium]